MSGIVMNQNQNERFTEINRIRGLYKKEMPSWRGGQTAGFKKFNIELLKNEDTDTVAFADNKLWNRNTERLMNRSTVFTQTDTVRQRYNNDMTAVKNDTFLDINQYLQPLKAKIDKAEQQAVDVNIAIDFSKVNRNLSKLLTILNPTTKKYLLHNKTD